MEPIIFNPAAADATLSLHKRLLHAISEALASALG